MNKRDLLKRLITYVKSSNVLRINGGMLEGGGQLIRTAIVLAVLLKRCVRIHSIRAKRDNPGLQKQHLTGAHLVAEMTGCTLIGAENGSTVLEIIPSKDSIPCLKPVYNADPDGAGSITLIAQVASLIPLFFPKESENTILSMNGGTNVSASPPIDHLQNVLIPLLNRMGASFTIGRQPKRGYYPTGRGHVELSIPTLNDGFLNPIHLEEKGTITRLKCFINGNSVSPTTLDEILVFLNSEIEKSYPSVPLEIVTEIIPEPVKKTGGSAHSKSVEGSSKSAKSTKKVWAPSKKYTMNIQFVAETDTGSVISVNRLLQTTDYVEQCKLIEVLKEMIEDLVQMNGACDEHTADQLLLPAALATGTSVILVEAESSERKSLHMVTVMEIISLFYNKEVDDIFNIEILGNGCRKITVKGQSYTVA